MQAGGESGHRYSTIQRRNAFESQVERETPKCREIENGDMSTLMPHSD